MSRWLILLIACLPILATAAEPAQLGRLFLTPSERAALDIVRQNSRPPERIVTSASIDENDGASTPPTPPIVTIQGYVKRSDGKGTVWVNGQPLQEKSVSSNLEVGRLQGNTNDVQIKLPSTGQTVKLKAGQSYDPGSGKVGSLREMAPQSEAITTISPAVKEKIPAAASKNSSITDNPTSGNPAPAAATAR